MALQDILFTASIVCFVLAAIFIVVAVVVFFVRNIPDVRADLSGKKRAEAVAQMDDSRARERRRGSSRRSGAASGAGAGTGTSGQVPSGIRVVEPARQQSSGAVAGSGAGASSGGASQRKHVKPTPVKAAPSVNANATTILPDDDHATTILPDDTESTTILPDDNAATSIPNAGAAGTMASETWTSPAARADAAPSKPENDAVPLEGFNVVKKIVLTDSAEIVQP